MTRRRLLMLVVWLLPLGLVVWWATEQPAPQLPSSGGAIAMLAAAVLVYAVATWLRAERWERILRHAEIPAKRADAYALVPIGYAGNNVLPARGGELLRMYLLGNATGSSKRSVLGTILAERILDAVALGVLLVALAYDLVREADLPSARTFALIGAGVVGLLIALGLVTYVFRAKLARIREALAPVVVSSRALLSRWGLGLLVFSVGIWVVEASVYLLTALAVHVHLGVQGALAVVAFTNAAALIPAAPGYLGTFDSAVIFAVKAVTTGAVNTAGYLILLRFVLFVPITVAGFVLLLVRYGGLSRLRAARAAAAAT